MKMASCDHIEATEKLSSWAVNKKFLPYKVHYFLLAGAHVGVTPYLPVYAKTTLGISATTIGILATVMQFSSTISRPLFGLLADCLNQLKVILVSLLCLEVGLYLLMLALPAVDDGSGGFEFQKLKSSPKTVTLLQLSPARVYDATVGLHSQPRISEWYDSGKEISLDKIRVSNTSKNSSYPISQGSRTKIGVYKKYPDNKRNNTSGKNFKCYLNCPTFVVGAICYQSLESCIDPHATGVLTCNAEKSKPSPLCLGLKRSTSFSVAYTVTSLHNSSKPFRNLKLAPDSFVYKRRSFKSWKNYTCNVTSVSCTLRCEEDIQFCIQNQKRESIYHTYQFWLFCVFALIGTMCQGALFTLSDTACYESLRDTKVHFGRQRLWGAIGWGTVASLIGYLNDLVTEESNHKDYSSGWYIMAIFSVLFLLNLSCLKLPKPPKSQRLLKDVRKFLITKQFILIFIDVFFVGVLTAFTTNYVLWYMESLGSTRLQMGLALTSQCLLGEAPFMFFSGWVISTLGHWHVITLTFLAFSARFSGYYFLVNPWLVLPIESLNGVTFGLFYTTMTSYAELISPPGTAGTVQGILGGTFQGLGSGVGNLIAGLAFDRYGGRRTFFLAAIFSACAALLHCITCLVSKPQKTQVTKDT